MPIHANPDRLTVRIDDGCLQGPGESNPPGYGMRICMIHGIRFITVDLMGDLMDAKCIFKRFIN